MPRLLPESFQEKILMAMGAAYLEENMLLDDLSVALEGDLEDSSEDAREFILEHVTDAFLRLDMNYGRDLRPDCLDLLQEMWGVHDRDSALSVLDNLLQQGHRTKFNVLKKNTHSLYKFKEIFKFDFDESEEVQLSDEEFEQLAKWIEKADGFVPKAGILAWDIARYIHLVRLCFFTGYLNDVEAWEKINQAWVPVKNQFSSWSEFSQSFLIGRTFWAGEEDPELKSICERLLGHKASPWAFFALESFPP